MAYVAVCVCVRVHLFELLGGEALRLRVLLGHHVVPPRRRRHPQRGAHVHEVVEHLPVLFAEALLERQVVLLSVLRGEVGVEALLDGSRPEAGHALRHAGGWHLGVDQVRRLEGGGGHLIRGRLRCARHDGRAPVEDVLGRVVKLHLHLAQPLLVHLLHRVVLHLQPIQRGEAALQSKRRVRATGRDGRLWVGRPAQSAHERSAARTHAHARAGGRGKGTGEQHSLVCGRRRSSRSAVSGVRVGVVERTRV